MEAGADNAVIAQRTAKTLDQRFVAGVDDDKTGRDNQCDKLRQQHPAERLFHQTVKTTFLETLNPELIIHRRRCAAVVMMVTSGWPSNPNCGGFRKATGFHGHATGRDKLSQ